MNMSANQYFPQFNTGNCENNNSEPYNNYRNMPPNISTFNPTNGYMNEFWNFQTRYSDYYGAGSDIGTRNRSFCQMLPMNKEYEKLNSLHSIQNEGAPLHLIHNKRSPPVRDLEDTSTPVINCPKYCESQPEKSSALRSLLTNPKRKIIYSPDYYTKNSQKSEPQKDSDGNTAKINITPYNNGSRNTSLSSIHQSQVPPTYDRSVLSSPYLCERDYLEYTPNGHHLFSNMPNHSYKGGYPTPPPYLAPNISDVNSDKHFESSPPLSTSSPSSAIEGLVSPPLSPNNQNFATSSQNMTFPAWLQKTDAKESLEDQKGKRTRQTYSRDQTLQLEQNFNMTSYVSRAQRALLAKNLNLTERQVKIWFQNRRMKAKKDQGRGASPSQNLQRTCSLASLAGTQLESQELIDPIGSMSVPSSFNKPVIPSQALPLASQPYTLPPTTYAYPVSPNNVQVQSQHQMQYNNTISTTRGDYLTNQPYFPLYGPQTHEPVGGSCGQNSPGSGVVSSNFGTVLHSNQAVTNVFAA